MKILEVDEEGKMITETERVLLTDPGRLDLIKNSKPVGFYRTAEDAMKALDEAVAGKKTAQSAP